MMFDVAPEHRALIGQQVRVAFAGRTVEGVVQTIEHEHSAYRFDPQFKVATGGATLSVAPEAIVE